MHKCLGDIDPSIRSAACDTLCTFFHVYACDELLNRSTFLSDNPRSREMLLRTLCVVIGDLGTSFVDTLLNMEWFLSTICHLVDDKIRFVRDESMKLLDALYKHEPDYIRTAIEKSSLRRVVIQELFAFFEHKDVSKDTTLPFYHDIKPIDYDDKKAFSNALKNHMQILQSNPDKSNWSDKVDTLIQLQSIIRGNSFKKFNIAMTNTFKSIWIPMQSILSEYRPAMIKEATQLLSLLSFEMKESFTNTTEMLLEDMVKHHASSKVNSESVDQCIHTWIENSLPPNLISVILSCTKEKNSMIRLKCTEYLFKVMKDVKYKMYIEKNIQKVDKAIKKYLVDSDSNVRKKARKIYMEMKRVSSDRAKKIYEEMDTSTKMWIKKEEEKNLDSIQKGGDLTMVKGDNVKGDSTIGKEDKTLHLISLNRNDINQKMNMQLNKNDMNVSMKKTMSMRGNPSVLGTSKGVLGKKKASDPLKPIDMNIKSKNARTLKRSLSATSLTVTSLKEKGLVKKKSQDDNTDVMKGKRFETRRDEEIKRGIKTKEKKGYLTMSRGKKSQIVDSRDMNITIDVNNIVDVKDVKDVKDVRDVNTSTMDTSIAENSLMHHSIQRDPMRDNNHSLMDFGKETLESPFDPSRMELISNLLSRIKSDKKYIAKLSSILKRLNSNMTQWLLKETLLFNLLIEIMSSHEDPLMRMMARDCLSTMMVKMEEEKFKPYFELIDPVYQKLVENQYKMKMREVS